MGTRGTMRVGKHWATMEGKGHHCIIAVDIYVACCMTFNVLFL